MSASCWYKDWWSGANLWTSWTISGYRLEMEGRGYRVVYDGKATVAGVEAALGQEDAYGWLFAGHGGAGVIFCAGSNGAMSSWDAKRALHHKLGFATLYACQAGEDAKWKVVVSQYGTLRMTPENIHPALEDWNDVPVVPNEP